MPATEFTLQTLLDQRTALQLHAEIAELTAREALARKTTAEHLLAARDIISKSGYYYDTLFLICYIIPIITRL